MTSEAVKPTSWWTAQRVVAFAALAALIAVVAWVLLAQGARQRESDRRTDQLFCTMSGVGPYEHGPETGELCADLLYDD